MLLFFLILIILLIFVIMLSDIKLKIDILEFNTKNKVLKFEGKISLYFLGKIKILSKKIDSKKNNNLINSKFIKNKMKQMKNCNNLSYKKNKKILKELIKNIKIEMFKTNIIVDMNNIFFTTFIVAFISMAIPNLIHRNIKKYNSNKYNWTVLPNYTNNSFISLKLKSIISIKVVHIINMLKTIGGIKNERASNRRLNANCYGKY